MSIFVWFTSSFGWNGGAFGMVNDMDASILAAIGNFVAPLFSPLGFGNWQSSVATVLGLVAKEEVVGTFGTLYAVAGDALESASPPRARASRRRCAREGAASPRRSRATSDLTPRSPPAAPSPSFAR